MKPSKYERLLAFIAAGYVMILFGYVIHEAYYSTPGWDVFTVFDVSYRNNNQVTTILTYGHGKYVLKGHYTLELDHTYYIEYRPGPALTPSIVLALEEVMP